ncbi:MAG: hypothetical protein ACRD5R_11980, partial [Candidatus Acidiferrales bacterium]
MGKGKGFAYISSARDARLLSRRKPRGLRRRERIFRGEAMPMRINPFDLERWQSVWENNVELNISESGV